ncbi:MAG: hypothetical protein IIA63_10810 [Nitrospinae bacterium]|nr:hypothetical protein [Nitrospinota bacterium]
MLPLIGGLGSEAHDWRNLFTIWDVLGHTETIGHHQSAGMDRNILGVGLVGLAVAVQ